METLESWFWLGVNVDEESVDSASEIGGAGAETEGVGGEAGKGGGGLNIDSHEGDAADFLLSNPKYHDCFMNVGNPDCEKVERIGVASVQLIAHSPVFRAMLENKQADLPITNINITDVSPATFKSMLRFVYGAKLPQLAPIEAAALVLCADKYKIPRLAQKALKRVIPTSAQDVFPALVCVTFASFPDLQIQVCKIIQQETDKIVQQSDFLKLSEECVLFILQQDTLNIDELELWKQVVCWAEHQSATSPERTVRDCMAKIIGHIRLLTLTLEEIAKCILPTKILTSEEFMDLTLAITNNKPLESPLLCKIPEKRYLHKEDAIAKSAVNEIESKTDDIVLQNNPVTLFFTKQCSYDLKRDYDSKRPDSCKSVLIIKPNTTVEIVSFTCRSASCTSFWAVECRHTYRCPVQWEVYNSICNFTLKRIVKNVVVSEKVKEVSFAATVCTEFIFVANLVQSQPLIVMPGETLILTLEFANPHPAYGRTCGQSYFGAMTFEVEEYSHVLRIDYRTQ